MAADIGGILAKGGADRIAFLRYCVLSMALEPVFVFLVQEYRYQQNHVRALALYDVFCAPNAPARLRTTHVLPPAERRLPAAIAGIRAQWSQLQLATPPDPEVALRVSTPPRHLFDPQTAAMVEDPETGFARVGERYDPALDPYQNLPGGQLTAGQRHFVERVWKPNARAQLLAAGFWRIADIE